MKGTILHLVAQIRNSRQFSSHSQSALNSTSFLIAARSISVLAEGGFLLLLGLGIYVEIAALSHLKLGKYGRFDIRDLGIYAISEFLL